jgi:hypothetical protein
MFSITYGASLDPVPTLSQKIQLAQSLPQPTRAYNDAQEVKHGRRKRSNSSNRPLPEAG